MKTNKVEPLKITVITFIITVILVLAATAVSFATAQEAHAVELNEAHRYVGGPASDVLNAFGTPDGWAYFNTDSSKDVSQGIWYYGDVEFHLLYVDDINSEGIICGVSER